MGDQWDWIESYCSICKIPLGTDSGDCGKHTPKRLSYTLNQNSQIYSKIKSLKWKFNRRNR